MNPDWKNITQFEGPEQSPGFLLWQVSSQWRRLIEAALLKVGLTHPQFVLLANLGWLTREGKWVSQAELARQCKTDMAMTSQVLRSLERKGYLQREKQAGNERSKFPRVTPQGAELIEQAIPLVEAVDRNFFKEWDSHSVDLFQKLASGDEKARAN
ncbi:MAG: MarR family transcriptional regulator [Verrucomicrobia bacterium]|nr:MarR family transcriptional regulator [Verrucomicrobiota bacterium]